MRSQHLKTRMPRQASRKRGQTTTPSVRSHKFPRATLITDPTTLKEKAHNLKSRDPSSHPPLHLRNPFKVRLSLAIGSTRPPPLLLSSISRAVSAMSARASGSDANAANGSASSRTHDHHDGSSGRAFTVEQKAAVIRVRRCKPTAFYDILGLEEVRATCTDAEIKKAYRKLSLLTHPDKNGYEGADEAFKMVSRAFQILSDPDKRSQYDKFGHDPDNRFASASAAASASPFANGFASSAAGPRGPMFEAELSPEELFRQFFAGGFGGPMAGFGGGPGFVFNLGGGPGIRVHQFGGARPRARPGGANAREQPQSLTSILTSLLPLILLFVFPILNGLFSSSGTAAGPRMAFDSPVSPYTKAHTSKTLGIKYYVNPSDVADYSSRQWSQLDSVAEKRYMHHLGNLCDYEQQQRGQLMQEAQGWFFQDTEKMERANKMPMTRCAELNKLTRKTQQQSGFSW
ncbi:uncharacterized protein PV09_03907 [Verruconis gallopava]|uniref:J domain-containing protein n=1 Tax=Verruconis gallopava TaxID=253628 RepID=A0A0D1YXG2_9PEZI|nr:uncharacterized protein PV09_03907 [Verruconis gallopava]KIW05392.1 hypothetical protein PV09_03907 [Verruconis gallopava]